MKSNMKIFDSMKDVFIGSIASIILLATATGCSCGNNSSTKDYDKENNDSTKIAAMTDLKNLEPEFEIITTLGNMKIKLYSKTPKHRANFTKLVKENFYDSLLFHRVIEDFMIQTGDPYTKDTSKVALYGQGGPDYTVPAEFVNEYWHKKGAVAAARKGDIANPTKASSGSQFYIVHNADNCLHLDGQYTIFGEVTEGFDVLDKIASVRVDRSDRPYNDIRIVTIKEIKMEETEIQSDTTAIDSTATVDTIGSVDTTAASK